MTQPTPKLPAPVPATGTFYAQLTATMQAVNNLIAYLAAQPAVPDLGPLREAVARLEENMTTETKTRSDQYNAILREVRKLLDVPPVQFPDLSGIQREAAAATAGLADLRMLVSELQAGSAGQESPDLTPLESRLTALESRGEPEAVDLEPLAARVAALEGQPALAVPDTALLEARIAQLETLLGLEVPLVSDTASKTAATPLPEGFPGRDALLNDGHYITVEAVQSATDDELDAVTGIGPATVQAIRDYTPTPDTEVTTDE